MIDTNELRFSAANSVRDLALLPSEVLELLDRLEAAEKAWKISDQTVYDLTEKVIPSINEGVRKVTLGFRWEGEAQHHIPTIKIEFDPVSPDSPNDAKGWQDRDRIASMLSPEVKP